MRRRTRKSRAAKSILGSVCGAALALTAQTASAQYRLKGDVYAFGTAPAPAGLLVLTGDAKPTDWADAEAVVWLGTGAIGADRTYLGTGQTATNTPTTTSNGDVMIANIHLREPHGWGELRLGRMLVTAGAIRPMLLDGANAFLRVPKGPTLQVFGGVPVLPGFAAQSFDWAAGGRLSQRIGEYASAGVSYLQRRSEGRIQFEELGFDASVTPARWVDAAGEVALDMLRVDVASARGSVAFRMGPLRLEAFALHRSPSSLLPATSLFAAIGDIPSTQGGLTMAWRAAPRLDISAIGSADSIGGDFGGRASIHAVLRLDDRGDGALGAEVRRQWTPQNASWTGGRLTARLPVVYRFHASAELELVVPDVPDGRGAMWPWGLVALGYSPKFAPWLDLAGGVEASQSPTRLASVAGIFRASATWEKR
ncbi:MAG: hypothetical protein U0441_17320 [Polyangiaceae bacterium]